MKMLQELEEHIEGEKRNKKHKKLDRNEEMNATQPTNRRTDEGSTRA